MTEEQRQNKAEHCRQIGFDCKKYNEYEILDGIAYVKMTNSDNVMICDADVWNKYNGFGWYEHKDTQYAITNINGRKQRFHQLVIPKKDGFVIDHINHNKLDNRRENLRYATSQVNSLNSKLSKTNKSGYKGVSQNKKGKWVAYIWVNYKSHYLGTYDTKEEAVQTRKKAEEIYIKPLIENGTR